MFLILLSLSSTLFVSFWKTKVLDKFFGLIPTAVYMSVRTLAINLWFVLILSINFYHMSFDRRLIQKAQFEPILKACNFKCSFEIFHYPNEDMLMNGVSFHLTLKRFPSVRSALRWLYDNYPDMFYFTIDLINEPPNVGEPYSKIL